MSGPLGVAGPALPLSGDESLSRFRWGSILPYAATALAFVLLFARPAVLLARDWWSNPEAGHGLLLAPVALWLAWRSRRAVPLAPSPALGLLVIAGAVMLRGASELAAELFTMRFAMMLALLGLVVFHGGLKRAVAWWLPFALLLLAIPLPELVTSRLALPLQFQASELGTALLEWRHVPVRLTGNIILIPGHKLFVTEACSGLRSLTALLSLGVLMGGLWLRRPWSRGLLVALTIPIAVVLNGVRVFLTGFLVYFVDPALGDGFMHMTEGWLLFMVSFILVAGAAWLMQHAETGLGSFRGLRAR